MGAKYMTFEELLRDEWKAGHARGREEGRQEGRELYLGNLVEKKREQGMTISQIAEILELTEDEVRKYYNTI